MSDNIAEVLRELSGLLSRISEQRNEQLKPQMDEPGETLKHENHLLESLIARLQEKPEKGRH
jgi:hypothetical protein